MSKVWWAFQLIFAEAAILDNFIQFTLRQLDSLSAFYVFIFLSVNTSVLHVQTTHSNINVQGFLKIINKRGYAEAFFSHFKIGAKTGKKLYSFQNLQGSAFFV